MEQLRSLANSVCAPAIKEETEVSEHYLAVAEQRTLLVLESLRMDPPPQLVFLADMRVSMFQLVFSQSLKVLSPCSV